MTGEGSYLFYRNVTGPEELRDVGIDGPIFPVSASLNQPVFSAGRYKVYGKQYCCLSLKVITRFCYLYLKHGGFLPLSSQSSLFFHVNHKIVDILFSFVSDILSPGQMTNKRFFWERKVFFIQLYYTLSQLWALVHWQHIWRK